MIRLLLLLGLGAGLGIGSVLLLARWAGQKIQIVPANGEPTATHLDFAPAASPPAAVLPDAVPTTGKSAEGRADPPRQARGVVLVIADGMGISHLFAARAQLAGPAGRLVTETLPVSGWLTTFSERSLYTDSAAAAAAMATGFKTAPAHLAISADGRPYRTVVEAAHAAGLATGLITDSYVLDATPAAFVAHARRRDYTRVAEHTAAAGLSLLAGTVPAKGAWVDTLTTALANHDTAVVDDLAAWRATLASGKPVAGLFPAESIADAARAPSLAELADSGLARLTREPNGFFLMVETEEVDTGAHNGDLERVIGGIQALDEVVRTVTTRARRAGDILVVVTSDHETGGLGITGGEDGASILVRWATSGHTAEPVPVFALGPGAERLAGVHDNTAVAHVIAATLGLDLNDMGQQ